MLSERDIQKTLLEIPLFDQIGGSLLELSADMLTISSDENQLSLIIQLPKTLIASEAERLQQEIKAAFLDKGESRPIRIVLSAPHSQLQSQAQFQTPPQPPAKRKLEHIKHIIVIGSGKGGVGKSTLTLNLGAALSQLGYRVGLLDADIYGPSMAQLLGATDKPEIRDGKAVPLTRFKMQTISMSYLIKPEDAVVWRAPMVVKALNQFLFDVHWGELDYLLIDLPPGTGDIPLTLAQRAEPDGAIIVTTGHDLSWIDAVRAMGMFQKLNLPILGIIENMAGFTCPHCGEVSHIFDSKDMEKIAQTHGSKLLGRIPLSIDMRIAADDGIPLILASKPENSLKNTAKDIEKTFFALAEQIKAALAEKTPL